MFIDHWNNEYLRIVTKLNLSIDEDIKATRQLESLLIENLSCKPNSILKKVEHLLQHPILIAGAGPSLREVRPGQGLAGRRAAASG